LQEKLPLKKERRKLEVWIWEADVLCKQDKIAFVQNDYAPFMKGKTIFPGRVKKSKTAPKVYNYKHNITHHEIYVKLNLKNTKISNKDLKWVSKKQIVKINPASLIQKALKFI